MKDCVLASDAFPILASLRLTDLVTDVAQLRRHTGIGEIHKVRVAIRRLRVALSIFRYLDPNDELKKGERELRRLQNRIGVVRDLDVFIHGVAREKSQGLDGGQRKSLRTVARKRRRKAATRCIDFVASKRYRKTIDDLQRHSANVQQGNGRRAGDPTESGQRPAVDLPMGDFARITLEKSYSKLREKELRAQDLDAAHLHSLRIRVKKFRYLTELMAELLPENAVDPLLGLLAAFQDELGEAHDADVAHAMLAKFSGTPFHPSEVPDRKFPTTAGLITSERRIHRAAMACLRTPGARA